MLKKRITAAVLAAALMLCTIPLYAAAAGESDAQTVTVGELKLMAEQGGLVRLQAGYITLIITGKSIDFDIVAAAFPGVAFSSISADFSLEVLQNGAQNPVGQAAHWAASLSYGGKTVELTQFADFVAIVYDGPYVAGATTAVRIRDGKPDFPVPSHIESSYTLMTRVRSTGVYGCTVRSVEFTDTFGHWAAATVKNLADRMVLNDIITVDSTEFFPSAKMSRAMFTDLFVRALGIEAMTELRFTDVLTDAWYYETLRTAVASGIIKGVTDTAFAPEEPISREQVAIIISRVMIRLGLEPEEQPDLTAFADYASISDASRAEIGPAVAFGIIRGDDLGNFRPKDSVTRAEAAVMIERFLRKANLMN